jgi:hypothetical protein
LLCYEQWQRKEGATRNQAEALKQLVRFYGAWGKQEEAAAWQERLDVLRRPAPGPGSK